jgi:hypothetical protein
VTVEPNPRLLRMLTGRYGAGQATGGTGLEAELARKPSAVKRFFKALGPGLITGASDDDPSGIATYAVAGAQLGYGLLWTAPLTFPLMAAVQFVCAKIGLVSSGGIAGVLRERYPRGLLYAVIPALLVANTINAGADLLAIGEGLSLLLPVPARDAVKDTLDDLADLSLSESHSLGNRLGHVFLGHGSSFRSSNRAAWPPTDVPGGSRRCHAAGSKGSGAGSCPDGQWRRITGRPDGGQTGPGSKRRSPVRLLQLESTGPRSRRNEFLPRRSLGLLSAEGNEVCTNPGQPPTEGVYYGHPVVADLRRQIRELGRLAGELGRMRVEMARGERVLALALESTDDRLRESQELLHDLYRVVRD